MQSGKFSIVTPSLQQGSYLEQACASVAAQTGVELEHVIVDGGSTDGTCEYLEGSHGLVWVSEPDDGQSDALNKGFALATGDIIGWLNADDFYLEGALARVRDHFDEHPEADVVFGDCLFVDADGRLIRGKAEHAADYRVLLYHGCYISSTAVFFRRRVLDAGDLRMDVDLRYVMDTELFVRLMAAGYRWSYLPEYLAAFRWHETNRSLDRVESIKERWNVEARFAPQSVPRSLYAAISYAYRLKHVVLKVRSGAYERDRVLALEKGRCMVWVNGQGG